MLIPPTHRRQTFISIAPSLLDMSQGFKQLRVAVIGGGLGGLASAVSLRRAGHKVDVFERRGFDVEVGASISCAANGSVHLEEWGISVEEMSPVHLVRIPCKTTHSLTHCLLVDETHDARLGDWRHSGCL